jgi:hypothetical protein
MIVYHFYERYKMKTNKLNEHPRRIGANKFAAQICGKQVCGGVLNQTLRIENVLPQIKRLKSLF